MATECARHLGGQHEQRLAVAPCGRQLAFRESFCGNGRLAARRIQRDRAVGRAEGQALSVVRQGDLVGIADDAFRSDCTRRAGIDFCDVGACPLSGLRADDEQAPHVAQPCGLHHRHGTSLDLSRFAGSERMNHDAWRRSMNDGEHRRAVGRELLRLSFADCATTPSASRRT